MRYKDEVKLLLIKNGAKNKIIFELQRRLDDKICPNCGGKYEDGKIQR